MQLFYADTRKVWKAGEVAGLGCAELARLFERYRLPRGTSILLDDAMRPVEPLSTWFRSMALDRMDAEDDEVVRAHPVDAAPLPDGQGVGPAVGHGGGHQAVPAVAPGRGRGDGRGGVLGP